MRCTEIMMRLNSVHVYTLSFYRTYAYISLSQIFGSFYEADTRIYVVR